MKVKHLILPVIALLLLWSCSGEQKPANTNAGPQDGPQMELSGNDTTTVLQLTSEFLDKVQAGNIEEAISSLYILDGEEVRPLPDDRKQECRFVLGMHTVYRYHIETLTFYKETDSEVKYVLTIQDPATTSSPATMNGLIRPVRRDGMWYITLANNDTETQRSELDE